MTYHENKKEFRMIYKKLRAQQDKGLAAENSKRICSNIIRSEAFKAAKYIFAYYPLEHEADIRMAARYARELGKTTAFPRVSGDDMDFFRVCGFEELKKGSFGVMEPDAGGEKLVPSHMIKKAEYGGAPASGDGCPGESHGGASEDTFRKNEIIDAADVLVIVPGLAFDRSGNRLGYGKGYYDKYFAVHTGCILMGASFDLQIADRIPAMEHDLKMDMIISQSGIFSF